MMGRALGSKYQVQVVATYEEALERMQTQFHYDGVVVGLYPRNEEHGREVLERIRAVDAHQDTPVMAVCGPSYGPGAAETLLEDGFDGALHMPFSQSELLAMVEESVEGK
jgi:CheY-like chemotaxis protein